MRGKPLRLASFLSSNDLIKELQLSRPTYYKWIKKGKFGKLIKYDQNGGYYYAHPGDLPKIQAIIGV